jgi:hypothetical protein
LVGVNKDTNDECLEDDHVIFSAMKGVYVFLVNEQLFVLYYFIPYCNVYLFFIQCSYCLFLDDNAIAKDRSSDTSDDNLENYHATGSVMEGAYVYDILFYMFYVFSFNLVFSILHTIDNTISNNEFVQQLERQNIPVSPRNKTSVHSQGINAYPLVSILMIFCYYFLIILYFLCFLRCRYG